MLGGLSGRRGLSGPISEPLDSESCMRSTVWLLKFSCFLRCSLLISSVIFCAIFSGVSLEQVASAKGDGFGSMTRIEAAAAAAAAEVADVAELDDGDITEAEAAMDAFCWLGLPNGWHLRRLVGR